MRGRDEHTKIKLGDLSLKSDENEEFLEWSFEHGTKPGQERLLPVQTGLLLVQISMLLEHLVAQFDSINNILATFHKVPILQTAHFI